MLGKPLEQRDPLFIPVLMLIFNMRTLVLNKIPHGHLISFKITPPDFDYQVESLLPSPMYFLTDHNLLLFTSIKHA